MFFFFFLFCIDFFNKLHAHPMALESMMSSNQLATTLYLISLNTSFLFLSFDWIKAAGELMLPHFQCVKNILFPKRSWSKLEI